MTVIIWGFVGGCGTQSLHRRAVQPKEGEFSSAEGLILEETSIPEGTIVYKVEAGDTLWEISRRFGVSVADIKETNGLIRDTISIGQRLIIPVEEDTVFQAEPSTFKEVKPRPSYQKGGTRGNLVVYRVRKGDSLWRIAQRHGITVERIVHLNGIPKNARLKPGQELLIPKVID